MFILVIHGPNLNMLGERETDIYGTQTLESINSDIQKKAESLGVSVETFQSNSESDIIEKIQISGTKASGIIINAGAFTHYSIAIRDALSLTSCTKIEVHISNIHKREAFRKESVTASVCQGQILGLGAKGYLFALEFLAS
ncbi:MAG: type II 3-dehydroquinate dehydratase [Candidatus Margulisbacteria bacterium]|nr:type II 3-dehydroquinate dehydratase [Candidatus Margulisiibacteriota bacterium]